MDGNDFELKKFDSSVYRVSFWGSYALRTFRRKLYMKLDFEDFLDINGNFYTMKADALIHYGLVEMATNKHILKIKEPLYLYKRHIFKK